MKNPDPLQYAIDEGFTKIFWWKEPNGVCVFEVVNLDAYDHTPKHVSASRLLCDGRYYVVNVESLKKYGCQIDSQKDLYKVKAHFFNDSTVSAITVDVMLKSTDEYNARREKEENQS